jgi:hypothetical protein
MTPLPTITEVLAKTENTYALHIILTDWVRLFSYATVALCSIFAWKMKKLTNIILLGNIVFGVIMTFGIMHLVIFASNRLIVSSTLLTIGVFTWMCINLYNLFKR